MTKTKRTGGMVLGILFIGLCVSFLRLFTIWRGSFQCNESWNQRIYRMELLERGSCLSMRSSL